MMKLLGLRVIRGSALSPDDQNNDKDHVGTVVETVMDSRGPGMKVVVQWDHGARHSYRVGHLGSGSCLRIADSAPAGIKHPGISCDVCREHNIAGIRWKCSLCVDYDLCTECYMHDEHITHPFLRIEVPQSYGIKQPAREPAKKIPKKGIFKEAKVTRGPDWEWGEQDGKIGTVGTVVAVQCWKDIPRSAVTVRWPSGHAYNYRRGYQGKVDLKCTQDAVDYYYYSDHLPNLNYSEAADQNYDRNEDELKLIENKKGNEFSTKEAKELTSTTLKETPNNKNVDHLIENFLNLFLSGLLSDFSLNVRDRTFHVHKAILAARSPVFGSMLQHDMKEKITGVLEIDDSDPDTFEVFLSYLYSGKIEKISRENVCDLYEVAEKYDVQVLKEECRNFMKHDLSAESICEVMTLALKHEDTELVESATKCFISKTKEILPSTEWQIFMKENPAAANELYMKSFDVASRNN